MHKHSKTRINADSADIGKYRFLNKWDHEGITGQKKPAGSNRRTFQSFVFFAMISSWIFVPV